MFTTRTLRDIRKFVSSLRHSGPKRLNGFFYWSDASKQELSNLEVHLDNIDHPERREIREILRELGVKSLLDAGCGGAVELSGYRAYGVDVEYTGLDRPSFMFKRARDNYSADPKANFVEGDLNNLSFEDNSFDAVLLKHVLEHQDDYKPAVEEAVRVASSAVIINLFQRLLPIVPFDVKLWHKCGYHENWYSKSGFQSFLNGLPVNYDMVTVDGASRQTAEIYVLKKIK